MFFKAKEDTKMRVYAHQQGAFNSKKGAFDYFYIVEGKSVEEAERLANIVASVRGVPEVPEVPASAFDRIKSYIRQGNELATENPRIADFLTGLFSGAITSLGGVAVGNQISENSQPQRYEIDDNAEIKELEDVTAV